MLIARQVILIACSCSFNAHFECVILCRWPNDCRPSFNSTHCDQCETLPFFFFLYMCHEPWLVSHETASSSAECSGDKLPFSFVRGQDLTMWDIVWVSPQGHRSVSVCRHFLLQAPQCPSSVWKPFSRDHCCRGRSKPGCLIVGLHTRENWPPEQTSSYASIDFWCQLVASPATTASWMLVVAMVG